MPIELDIAKEQVIDRIAGDKEHIQLSGHVWNIAGQRVHIKGPSFRLTRQATSPPMLGVERHYPSKSTGAAASSLQRRAGVVERWRNPPSRVWRSGELDIRDLAGPPCGTDLNDGAGGAAAGW